MTAVIYDKATIDSIWNQAEVTIAHLGMASIPQEQRIKEAIDSLQVIKAYVNERGIVL